MIKVTKIKRRNPKNEYILSDIKIKKSWFSYNKTIFKKYYAVYPIDGINYTVAWAIIQPDEDFVSKVEVNKDFRRFGIATLLYNYIEKDLNIILRPVKIGKAKGPDNIDLFQDEDGRMFWENRLKQKNPYRKDLTCDKSELEKLNYKKGYLLGLVKGLRKSDLRHHFFIMHQDNYFWKGYYKGLDDSQEQLKLIPKNKLKQYIKELEDEIDSL